MTSKEVLRQPLLLTAMSMEVSPIGSCLPPLSQDIKMHFSLDMALQVGCMQLNPVINLYASIGALS